MSVKIMQILRFSPHLRMQVYTAPNHVDVNTRIPLPSNVVRIPNRYY